MLCREVADAAQNTGHGNQPALHHACLRAMASVRSCPCRVYNDSVLKKLNGVGAVIAGVVQDNLWAKYGPDAASGEEEAAWKDYLKVNVRIAAALAP